MTRKAVRSSRVRSPGREKLGPLLLPRNLFYYVFISQWKTLAPYNYTLMMKTLLLDSASSLKTFMLFPLLTPIWLCNCTFHQFYTSKCGHDLAIPLPCASSKTCVCTNPLALPFSWCLSNPPSKILNMQ